MAQALEAHQFGSRGRRLCVHRARSQAISAWDLSDAHVKKLI